MQRIGNICAVALALVALAFSPSPLAWADAPPETDIQVAQTQPAAPSSAGDSRNATLGDIRWLAERNERRWLALHNELSNFKNTVIVLLGAILAALLGIIAVLLPRREKARRELAAPRPPEHAREA